MTQLLRNRRPHRPQGDSHETCDLALHGANDGRLLEVDFVPHSPDEERHCSCDVSVEDSGAGVGRGGVRISSVKAIPADPDDTGTGEHHEDIVGLEVFAVAL